MAAIVDISGTYLPPTPPRTWNNRYYFVRHGQSKANESGLIVSGIEGLEKRYGLTALGVSQAHQAAKTLKHDMPDNARPLLISSDFSRALETAIILADQLQAGQPTLDQRLRERSFGGLNLGPSQHYKDVWEHDLKSASHRHFDVEPLFSVIARTTGLVLDLEAKFKARDVVLIAHGDVLQVLQTWFLDVDCRHHRYFPHLGTGQARMITQTLEGITSTVRLSELASPLSQVDEPRPRVLNSSMPSTGANSPVVSSSPTPSSTVSHSGSGPALSDIDEQQEDEESGWLPWIILTTAVLAVVVTATMFVRHRSHVRV
eukprot:m.211565 g.211565  ORF g.211565 m.211565 type:complete len:316 (-) comp17151_c0_seq6:56-1003(-)